MTKQEVINQIRQAKMGHKRWVSYAKALHLGIPVDKKAVPMVETECGFGKWYYGDAAIFSDFDSFQAIEQPHSLLHNQYMQLFKARKQPIKSGLFVSSKSAAKQKADKLDKMMGQLLQVSEMLLESLKEFENEVKNMSDTEISQLV